MQAFVEAAGIPFYTTPQGRGVVPDDHPCSYLAMRSSAFRDADLIIVLGTRMNYIIGHASPPRFGPNAKIARIDICPEEIASAARYVDIPIVGDCKAVLGQLLDGIKGKVNADSYKAWRQKLAEGEAAKRSSAGANKYAEDGDIHPVRMLEEVRNFAKRDCDPVRRWAGDAELWPPDDADVHAGPSFEFRSVRHDGRRPAVRRRRQGCLSRQAGDRGARRRLAWA